MNVESLRLSWHSRLCSIFCVLFCSTSQRRSFVVFCCNTFRGRWSWLRTPVILERRFALFTPTHVIHLPFIFWRILEGAWIFPWDLFVHVYVRGISGRSVVHGETIPVRNCGSGSLLFMSTVFRLFLEAGLKGNKGCIRA